MNIIPEQTRAPPPFHTFNPTISLTALSSGFSLQASVSMKRSSRALLRDSTALRLAARYRADGPPPLPPSNDPINNPPSPRVEHGHRPTNDQKQLKHGFLFNLWSWTSIVQNIIIEGGGGEKSRSLILWFKQESFKHNNFYRYLLFGPASLYDLGLFFLSSHACFNGSFRVSPCVLCRLLQRPGSFPWHVDRPLPQCNVCMAR